MSKPPSRPPPGKPPPLPPKPAILGGETVTRGLSHGPLPLPPQPPLAGSSPQRPLAVPPRRESMPQQQDVHGAQRCGQLWIFGGRALTETRTSEATLMKGMADIAVIKVAPGYMHGAVLAGGRRAGLYTWQLSPEGDILRPKLETEHFQDVAIRDVECGGDFTVVVTEGGEALVWQLPPRSDRAVQNFPLTPTRVPLREPISRVACGAAHVLLLSEGAAAGAGGQQLLALGSNRFGQLGIGEARVGARVDGSPRAVEGLAGHSVVSFSAGARHSAAVTASGAVLTWGDNQSGQCGISAATGGTLAVPRQVAGGDWDLSGEGELIACGHSHTLWTGRREGLFACGRNAYGQLGIGSTADTAAPTRVRGGAAFDRFMCVAAGECHSLAVTVHSTVFVWGSGARGQLGAASAWQAVCHTPRALMEVRRGMRLNEARCGPFSSFLHSVDERLTAEHLLAAAPLPPPSDGAQPPLVVVAASWNVNSGQPGARSLEWLRPAAQQADIVAVALQEVDLRSGALLLDSAAQVGRGIKGAIKGLDKGFGGVRSGWTAGGGKRTGSAINVQTDRGEEWRRALTAFLASTSGRGDGSKDPDNQFVEVVCRQMVGVMLAVAVRRRIEKEVEPVWSDSLGCGLMGAGGNKGAVAASVRVRGEELCFVGAHLAAHDQHVAERNAQYHELVQGLLSDAPCAHVLGHDAVVWAGDLNYRIDLPRELVLVHARFEDWAKMAEKDQLCREVAEGRAFVSFREGAIGFAPTFKYDLNSSSYDSSKKQRTPAYCDRVLFRNRRAPRPRQGLHLVAYGRGENRESDHRPVHARFELFARARAPPAQNLAALARQVEALCLAPAGPRRAPVPPGGGAAAAIGATGGSSATPNLFDENGSSGRPPAPAQPLPPLPAQHPLGASAAPAGEGDLLDLLDAPVAAPLPPQPGAASGPGAQFPSLLDSLDGRSAFTSRLSASTAAAPGLGLLLPASSAGADPFTALSNGSEAVDMWGTAPAAFVPEAAQAGGEPAGWVAFGGGDSDGEEAGSKGGGAPAAAPLTGGVAAPGYVDPFAELLAGGAGGAGGAGAEGGALVPAGTHSQGLGWLQLGTAGEPRAEIERGGGGGEIESDLGGGGLGDGIWGSLAAAGGFAGGASGGGAAGDGNPFADDEPSGEAGGEAGGASVEAGLPEGWAAAWSAEHGEWYFWHHETEEVRWERPA